MYCKNEGCYVIVKYINYFFVIKRSNTFVMLAFAKNFC
jgi:hypothetical protein